MTSPRSIRPSLPRRRRRAPKGSGVQLRNEILDATEALLLETGDQAAVSIRAIARAVGVSPPAIYLHFADKDELLVAVCGRAFSQMEHDVDAAVRDAADPGEELRRRGRAYVAFGVAHPELYRILFMGNSRFAREDYETGRLPGMQVFGRLVDNVARCMEAGVFAPGDPFLVATGLWVLVHGITSLRIAVPGFPGIESDTVVAHLLDTASRGLAPPP